MSERTRAPIRLTAIRVGSTDMGDGSAVLDEEGVTVAVRANGDYRPILVPLATIDRVTASAGQLSFTLHDGASISLATSAAETLRDDVLIRCRAMPEVTRALRTFGSRRGQHSTREAAASEQQRFFSPLLEARRRAGAAGGPLAVMAAFEADAIAEALTAALASFAIERHGETGPSRRALEAELLDVAEPLTVALAQMGEAANHAGAEIEDLRLWRAWSAAVRIAFETADRVWLGLDAVLENASPTI